MLIATCSSDLIVILRRGSLSDVTQLRVIPSREPSLLEVLLTRGVTSWVSNHAAQALVTHFESVSTFLSYHHVVLPWSWPPHGSYLSQGFSAVVWVLHKSGYPLLVLELMALKPPFSSLHCCSEPSEPETFSRCCPLHGLSYPWVSRGNTVDALT